MSVVSLWAAWPLAIGGVLASSTAPDGTDRMVERLETLARQATPLTNPFMSRERVLMVDSMLSMATDRLEVLNLRFMRGIELLHAGESALAIEELRRLERLLQDDPVLARPGMLASVRLYLGIAGIRLGVDDNCMTGHHADSCLVPIHGHAVLSNPRGPRIAIEAFTKLQEQHPGEHGGRWLLNLAHMYTGEYPAGVPTPWLIPPRVFESDYDIKRYPDIAPALGLDVNELAGGSVVEDFDGDGLLDIMVSSWGFRDQLRLFRNNGDGTFTERTEEAGLLGLTGGLNMVQTDYTNDGHPDVFVLRGAWLGEAGRYPNSLLRNNGDGTFTDVTEEAGLLSLYPTQTAVWFDYDNDGWLDLFIGNESTGESIHPCELYRNNGDGTFTEVAAEVGLALVGFVKGVVAGDYNNDGRPDLYVSLRNAPNRLFRNDGPTEASLGGLGWRFTDVTIEAGVSEPIPSFTTWFWDYDNDGWLDIFVAGYNLRSIGDMASDYLGRPHRSERARLYRNLGDGTFADVTRSVGLSKLLHAMGANFGDLDNDGWLDFYVGTGDPAFGTLMPNRMFRNAEGRFFQDVTTSGGFGHLQKGHGVSFADIDNDGDQDIHVVMGGAMTGDNYYNLLLENPGHGNRWITLQLEGVISNRPALGARIRVVVETSKGGRAIHRTVSTGGSFGSNPLRQEIGLGQADSIRLVEVTWPAGETEFWTGLGMDSFYRLREGDPEPIRMNPGTFTLKGSQSPDHDPPELSASVDHPWSGASLPMTSLRSP